MGAGEIVFLVQKRCDAFDGAAIVGENDGGAMLANLVGEESVDRRPHRLFRQRTELLDWINDEQIEVLANASIHDGHWPRLKKGTHLIFSLKMRCVPFFSTAEIAGDLIQRPLRRR